MKYYPFLGLILLNLISLKLSAQRFENAYLQPGNEVAKDVCEMSDGSIISVGYATGYGNGDLNVMVMKTNASGTILWTKFFGGTGSDIANAVAISPQQEIYIAGNTTVGANVLGYLLKLNAAGALIWSKTFGSGTNNDLRDIGFKSSRLYCVGRTNGAGAGGNDIWMLKTDTAGNVIQNKTLGTSASDEATALCFTNDGNFALTGQSLGYFPSSVFLAKLNLACDTIWTRQYDLNLTTNSSGIISKGIAQLTTNELVFTGTGYDVGNYPSTFHVKTDLSGNTIFTKWTSFLSDEGYDVIAGKNGAYYLLVNVCNFGCRTYIVKYDNNGNQLLSKQYGYPGSGSYGSFTTGSRLFRSNTNRLFLAGISSLNAYNQDILLARLDSNGVAYTNPAPVISATGPATFCLGAGTRLVAPAGHSFYSWARMFNGNLLFMNVNNDTITPTSTGSYYCVCWTGNSFRISNVINITVNTFPSSNVTVTGSLNMCAASGDSVILTAPSGNSYQWQVNGNPISGATNNSYVAKSGGSYAVNITSSCGSTLSSLFQVNANYIATPVINCNGDCFSGAGLCYPPGSLNASVPGTITDYRWYVDGIPYGPGGAGASNVVPPYPQGNYTCTVTNGCGTATSAIYTVQSGPSGGASGTEIHLIQPAGCGLGSNITLQAPIGSSGPYQWLLGGSPITNATNYWYIAQQSGWYSLQYYDPYCMTINTTPSINIALNSPQPVLSAPNGPVNCAGNVALSVSPNTAGMLYEWFRDDISLGQPASNSTYTATQSGVYKCRVYNPVCGWDITNTITVSTAGITPVLTSTGNTICSGTTTTFICTPGVTSGPYTYQWYRNGILQSGAANPTFSASAAGTYYCTITSACGTNQSNSLSLTILPTPNAVITSPASTVICTPQSRTLSAVPVSGCTYQWYNGASPINGAVDSVYDATTAGNYSVRLKSGVCVGTSNTVTLTTASGVVASVTTSGYPQICSGEVFTMSATANASYTYQWTKNGTAISGATASTYSTGSAGNYAVIVSNACGAVTIPATTLVVRSNPSAAITALGPLSFCAGDSVQLQTTNGTGYTYYWKQNGSLLSGATSNLYTAKSAGSYKAGVFSQYGCLKEGTAVTVSVPCREDGTALAEEGLNFEVFPNPTNETATLLITGAISNSTIVISVTDILGRETAASVVSSESGIQITPPAPGIYLITVTDGVDRVTRRLLRVN